MNRLEDKFRVDFEHFEPEVGPKVWQQISGQLAPSPAPHYGASKGIIAKTGIKGLAAILAAGGITALGIWFFSGGSEKEKLIEKVSVTSGNTESISPQNGPAQPEDSTSVNPEAATNYPSIADGKVSIPDANPADQSKATIEKPAISPDPISVPQPRQAVTAVYHQQKEQPGTSPLAEIAATNTTDAETEKAAVIQPVLILSGRRGFAPFTLTAMTNQLERPADFDFGDGSTSSSKGSVTHTYVSPGTYTIRCDAGGIRMEETIVVSGEIPTAFSPNGDGVNDQFLIDNQDGAQIEIRIFDRSGRLVFTRKGSSIEWDGTLKNGDNAEAGTYLYDIFATSEGGSSWKQKGTIHIFK